MIILIFYKNESFMSSLDVRLGVSQSHVTNSIGQTHEAAKTDPWSQYKAVSKQSGQISYIERFNCTLRQRCARLVRKTLSFSKKLTNHIGLIKYFICDYNKQLRALPI